MTTILSTIASALGVSIPVFIAVATITALYVIYSLITGRGLKVNLGKFQFGVSFDPKIADKSKPEITTTSKPSSPCIDCSKKDLYVEKAKSIVNSFSESQNSFKKDLILQQMNFAEEKVSELRILLCKQYSRTISNKLNIGVISAKDHADYKFYRMLIYYILLSKVKDGIIKKALKENHFLDLSNIEFEQYLQRKIDLIIDNISEGLDTYYADDLLIAREELFRINDQILLETKSIIRSIFDNARNVSENYSHKMISNKLEMEKLLNDI